jgi:CAAX protease family protein
MEEPETYSEETVSNVWVHHGELRIVWKLSSFLAVFFFTIIIYLLILFLLPLSSIHDYLYPSAFLLAASTATLFVMRGIERKQFLDVGLHAKGSFGQVLSGTFFGSILILLNLLIFLIIGGMDFRSSAVTLSGTLMVLLEGLLIFAIAAAAEELLMRGYPFQRLLDRYGSVPALIATSIVFSVIHLANPFVSAASLANIFLAGMLLGSAYLATGSLWFPIGIHFGWNFIQGSVFGFPVSGIIHGSVFVTLPNGPDYLTGASFGPEGGLAATFVLLVGTSLLWIPAIAKYIPGNPVAGFGVNRERELTENETK